MRSIVTDNRGMSLVIALVMMMILLTLTGASLLISGISSRTTSNVKTGTTALQAADAGLRHALAVIPAGSNFNSLLTGSVTGFPCVPSTPCNGTTNKATLTGSLGNYTYTVVAQNNTTVSGETATNDSDKIVILTSTATGPDGSTRRIQAYIQLSGASWTSVGTLYVPGQVGTVHVGVSDPNFNINGNDTNVDGTAGPGSAIPGIGTNDSATAADVKSQISSGYYDNITGLGYSAGPPITPSIMNSGTLDVATLAQNILNLGIEGTTMQTLNSGTYSSGTWGTQASPMITHITGKTALKGDLSGYGVLIVDGDVKIADSFSFKGLMIFQGNKIGIKDDDLSPGDALLYGAMVWKDTDKTGVNFGKGGRMNYSSQALSIVTKKWALPFQSFPQAPKLMAWNELMQ